MQSSTASKNVLLAKEVSIFKNSILVPLAETHRALHHIGGSYVQDAANLVSFSGMLDAVTGDSRGTDYISANSQFGYIDKEHKNLNRVFPRFPLDLSDIEGVFYNAIDAVESLLSVLGNLFAKGHEELEKIIILLEEFSEKLKRTVIDTALKVFMHTKIEMIMKGQQQTLRVA